MLPHLVAGTDIWNEGNTACSCCNIGIYRLENKGLPQYWTEISDQLDQAALPPLQCHHYALNVERDPNYEEQNLLCLLEIKPWFFGHSAIS